MIGCEVCGGQRHQRCPLCGLDTHFLVRPDGEFTSGFSHAMEPRDGHAAAPPGWTGPDIPRVPLAGLAETCKILGVSDARVGQLMADDPAFPQPVDNLACGTVWYRREVEMYRHERVRRRPGRPRRTQVPPG